MAVQDEHWISPCELQQLFGFLMCSSGNFACDFHDPLFLGMFDHCSNAQIWPRL